MQVTSQSTSCEKASVRNDYNICLWNALVCLLLSWAGGVTERQQLYDKNITNVNIAVTVFF